MSKRLALAAVVLGTGGLLAVAPAQADVCVQYDITVNDTSEQGGLCLPPEGAPAPELPAPPALG